MWERLAALTTVKHARTPDEQRRGQILVSLSLGIVAILATVGLTLTLLAPTVGRFINLGLAILVFATAALLGRQGFINIGAYILIIVSGLGAISGIFLNPNSPFNLFYLLICVLLASILLTSNQIWLVLGMCLLALVGAMTFIPPDIKEQTLLPLAMSHLAVLLTVSALITFIGARSLDTALAEARKLRQQAEEANQQLAQANAQLETRIVERTAEIQRLADEQRATMAQLAEALHRQQQLNQLLIKLDVPIIPVKHDTLVAPLIGTLDTPRIQHLLEASLKAIEEMNACTLVIDTTGVAVIDTHAAAGLLHVAQAARLMGATTILAGIRPEVAQTLVSLGVDLSLIRTASTLEAALEMVESRMYRRSTA